MAGLQRTQASSDTSDAVASDERSLGHPKVAGAILMVSVVAVLVVLAYLSL